MRPARKALAGNEVSVSKSLKEKFLGEAKSKRY
jgi:hypothetical protein